MCPARAESADGPGARDRILEAARAEFAERGYDKTTVRGIARAAGVDAALVHHCFGTKDEVFAAAIEATFEPVLVILAILGQGKDGIGERLARFFTGVRENPAPPVRRCRRSSAPRSPTRRRRQCSGAFRSAGR